MPDRIAILGWGSLLWDSRPEFDQWHGPWQHDGPVLKIEFSRISISRSGALTLVLDARAGGDIQAAYCLRLRSSPSQAVEDLRKREGTTTANVGYVRPNGEGKSRTSRTRSVIAAWAKARALDAVVWTDLQSNFPEKTGKPFSVDAAMAYLQGLTEEGRRAAFDYISNAPDFVDTPLRRRLKGVI
jgi:hypothetical protein